MKLTKNIWLQELVSEKIYTELGNKSLYLIDPKIPNIAQFIRDRFQVSIFINTWHMKKSPFKDVFNYSGFRENDCGIGAQYSQHKFGRALDIKQFSISYEELRDDIKRNRIMYYELGIRAIEEKTEAWLHIDTRYTNKYDILFFNP